MRIERTPTSTTVTLRQSWINDALNCQERGRRMILQPEMSITSDSAAIGTAVHAGIEATINERDGLLAIADEFTTMFAEPMNMTLNMTHSQMVTEAIRMYDMWRRDIEAHIGEPLHTEQGFNVPWFNLDLGSEAVDVRLSGTIDLVTTTAMWDWKTSGRKYQAKAKQDTAVQPTVYAIAAEKLGWLEWPIQFNYGLMVRGKNETQILAVSRTRNHEVWLARVVEPLIRQALALGTDHSWPVNDTHALCSQRWCPWWAQCKGAALSPLDLYTPTIKESSRG